MKTLETFHQPIIIPTAMDFSIKMFDDKYEYEESKLLLNDDYASSYSTTTTTTTTTTSFLRETTEKAITATATSVIVTETPPSSQLPSTSTSTTKTTLTRKQKANVIQKYLPADFVPSPYTVILGRGKKCTESCGNRRLRIIATTFLGSYTKASSKEQKSVIVSEILAIVQEANQNQQGAFVREICNSNNDAGTSQWIEVSTALAREKIGQVLRDLLHTKYRSSIKNKVKARREKRLASWQDSTNTAIEDSSSLSSSSCSISNSSNHSSRSSSSSICDSSTTDSSYTTSNTTFYDEEEDELLCDSDHELLVFTQGLF